MNKDERNNNKLALTALQAKDSHDKFPAGIHVLAVDDDETCLLWLENVLLECNYRVTTTLYAMEALDMLRQNKGLFDLVITDVQMPEIDGFQLLETIGLEMNLPVIMLSIYDKPEYVERGVVHGAVDYLVKPVRKEAIQNIWQHVLRKRRGLDKGKKTVTPDSVSHGAVNGPVADSTVSGSDASNRKRRGDPSDKDDEDYEDEDDSGRENDEQTSQKRPRVVWTPDLHKKFVLAVNQLGMDKAVPKKILDIMDVAGLTRENVASHLQKYRLYLKRISDGNQQQPMFGSFGRMNSLEAMNNFHRTGSLPNSLLSGCPPSLSGILGGRPNSINGLNFRSISSSDLIQSGQNLRNSISPLARLTPNGSLFHNGNSFQGVQGGFEQDSPQAGKTMGSNGALNPGLRSTGFGVSDNFADPTATMNGSNSGNGLMFSAASLFSQTNGSSSSGMFKFGGISGSANAGFLNHSGTPDSWRSASQTNGTFTPDLLPMNSNAMNPNANGISSTGIQQQLVPSAINNMANAANTTHRWDNGKHNEFNQNMNTVFGSLNPITKANGNGGIGSLSTEVGQNQNHPAANGNGKQNEFNQEMDAVFGSLNQIMKANGNGGLGSSTMGIDQNHPTSDAGDFMGQVNGTSAQNGVLGNNDRFIIPEQADLPQNGYIPNNMETINDIVNSIITRENNGGPSTMFDEEFNFDDYSPGSGL